MEATETEDGKTTDITEKISEQVKKQKKNSGDNTGETTPEKEAANPFGDFLPFDETQRSEFDFHRLDEDVVDGKDVLVIESVARTKNKERFEGKYYIDQKTLDVLKIDIKPSENPFFVKEMRMEMDFEVLPEGNFVMKKMKAKAVAKLVVKTIRQVAEVEYSNYQITGAKQ